VGAAKRAENNCLLMKLSLLACARRVNARINPHVQRAVVATQPVERSVVSLSQTNLQNSAAWFNENHTLNVAYNNY
jgi:hypothetical protein